MTDIKVENQKLFKLVHAVRNVDLDKMAGDIARRDAMNSKYGEFDWIKSKPQFETYRIIVEAALKFREAVKDTPRYPEK